MKRYKYCMIVKSSSERMGNFIEKLNGLGEEGYVVIKSRINEKDDCTEYFLMKEIDDSPIVNEQTNIANCELYAGFVKGYQNHIWHNRYEVPDTELFVKCLVELEGDYYDGRIFKVCDYHKGNGYSTEKGWINSNEVIRWAYMRDIIPTK